MAHRVPKSLPDGRQPTAELGGKLRRARVEHGMGVRELARRIDVSPSLISRIERGTVMPSVATLFSIRAALEIPLGYLIEDDATPDGAPEIHRRADVVQRAGERKAIQLASGVHWERLTPGPDPVEFNYSVYEPGGASSDDGTFLRHSGREYGYVIDGTLSVRLAFETYRLEPGDSIAFDSTTPHRLFNEGKKRVVSVWMVVGG